MNRVELLSKYINDQGSEIEKAIDNRYVNNVNDGMCFNCE